MPPKKENKEEGELAEASDTAAAREGAAALASQTVAALNEDIYSSLLSDLAMDASASERSHQATTLKLLQLRADQEEANEYLNKKIEDNYRVIAKLEGDIMAAQVDRRTAEFALIERVVSGKEEALMDVENKKHQLAEKESDLELISGFSDRREETSERLEQLRRQISKQAEAHGKARDDMRARHKEDLQRLRREWGRKMSLTKSSLVAITEDNLSKSTRRVLMEADKMKHEVEYQATELKKLHRNTSLAKREKRELQATLASADDQEVNAAKKAHMYSRIVAKLKDKIDQKIKEIDEKEGEDADMRGERQITVKEKLDRRMKGIIEEIRGKRREISEFNQTEMEARTKLEAMRKCQTPVVAAMLSIIRGFYDDEDGGFADENDSRVSLDEYYEDDHTIASTSVAAKPPKAAMHRGYTQDLLPQVGGDSMPGMLVLGEGENPAFGDPAGPLTFEDNEVGNSSFDEFSQASALAERNAAQQQLLQEERQMIGDIVGNDVGLANELFGDGDGDGDGGDEHEGGADGGEDAVASISELPRRVRSRYLRSMLVKLHSFQLQNPPAMNEAAVEEPMAGPNILTALLGGDAVPVNREFFAVNAARGGRKETASSSTQTDATMTFKKSSTEALDEEYKAMVRRKLHRGVESPAYSYNKMISVDGDGGLWRKFGGTKAPNLNLTTSTSTSIPNAHQALAVPSRQATPEVTGWAKNPVPPAGDALTRSGKKGPRRMYAGNPGLMAERMNDSDGAGIIDKNRTDRLLKAAGLL
jgi:hypothetical protein